MIVNESNVTAEHSLNSERLNRSSSNRNRADDFVRSPLETRQSRSSVRYKRVLLHPLNAQAISEFLQNLAQFGAERNTKGHPIAVQLLRALSRQPDFIDAR